MKYAIDVGLSAFVIIPNFTKIGSDTGLEIREYGRRDPSR
jgi:hypothetical protein